MKSFHPATMHTGSGVHKLTLRLADNFLQRFVGLMMSRPMRSCVENMPGLLITRCPSVHTAFMRYAIDVVYLDGDGVVTKCIPQLKPWRASRSSGRDGQGRPLARAVHTLELPAGAIERLAIRHGDRLCHPSLEARKRSDTVGAQPSMPPYGKPAAKPSMRLQRGASMIEFAVVGPIVSLLGLAVLQYGMLFFAKNQMNQASFMAARAGSMANASLNSVGKAYANALIPLYGGGLNTQELARSRALAICETTRNPADLAAAQAVAGATFTSDDQATCTKSMTQGGAWIELLNPTKESFDDWKDDSLTQTVGNGKRVIPNRNLAFKDPGKIGGSSGQSLQDANVIKVRITQGYAPKVPLMGLIYTKYLKWLDTKTDPVYTQLVSNGRIPVVTDVTMQMQSDAIEPDNPVSVPGMGNGGNPTNPGDPPVVTTDPPACGSVGCTVPPKPVDPGGTCTGPNCPVCDGA
ncbi:uncharacterized membrane protein (UPF0127 family) [Collimonas sp. PA-H2]|uniref:DUF192 domain-containing protein n=1 Tax=Collimonas sp. PA-H2 TaxID=1881062 RepID=UPI000BFA0E71|nr:DUF192 domain-containing protein [Collimonas sp. PA-H2]PFH09432.1 uncharacterized membrane protein (UPF0127 family) [Collimonas sp. PA-H2]